GSGEFVLQAKEVFVRLEVRIVLHHSQQAAEGSVEALVGRDLVLGSARGKQGGAGVGDLAENRLHQVRNQVRAALQDDVHLRPCSFHRFVLSDQGVAHANVRAEKQ